MSAVLVSAWGLCACRGSSDALINAAIWTAVGASASAVSRLEGGCYAACTTGTYCEVSTGFCQPLPCGGRCTLNEVCDARTEECVRTRASPELGVEGGVRTSTRSP